MSFETNPFPERIVKLSMPMPITTAGIEHEIVATKPNEMLSVGIQIITETGTGLKVVPHKAVVFAFGDEDNPEQRKIDVPPSMARGIAARINEMCDVIEGKK